MVAISSTTLFVLATALTGLAGALLFGPAMRRHPGQSPAGKGNQSGWTPVEADECDAADDGTADVAAIHTRLHTLSLGPAALNAVSGAAHRKVAKRIAAAAGSVAVDARHAPRRPGLLPQLLRAVNDDQGSRDELAVLIARDPALVANLIRLANSALYRRRADPVESIGGAIALLGTSGIRSLVAAAVMQPLFQHREGRFPGFADVTWQHTLYAATAAETHAAVVEQDDRFAAQLLGLLHGLGSIVVFRIALERHAAMPGNEPHPAVIANAIDTHGPLAAARIADGWGVSRRLQQALLDQQCSGVGEAASPLGRSLAFGRLLATLALLYEAGTISKLQLHAALYASGPPAPTVQRIWRRLTANRG